MIPAALVTDEERTELLALYQVSTQDLAFFKSQQWALTNYCLVALAAIAAVPQIPGLSPNECMRAFLCAVAVVLTAVTMWQLWRLHGSIEERRARLSRVYNLLSQRFRDARGIKKSVDPFEMLLPLQFLLLAGVFLAGWVVLCAT